MCIRDRYTQFNHMVVPLISKIVTSIAIHDTYSAWFVGGRRSTLGLKRVLAVFRPGVTTCFGGGSTCGCRSSSWCPTRLRAFSRFFRCGENARSLKNVKLEGKKGSIFLRKEQKKDCELKWCCSKFTGLKYFQILSIVNVVNLLCTFSSFQGWEKKNWPCWLVWKYQGYVL